MQTVTLDNVKELLSRDNLIQLEYIYSYKSCKYWRLVKAIPVKLSNNKTIILPAGFETDLSSAPRFLWSIEPSYGDFLLAALIHDYLYIENIGTRSFADKEMLIWSNAINKNRLDNKVRYWAVRLFGKSWWNKSRKDPDKVPELI